MNKILRAALKVLGVAIAVILVVLAYIAATFDPNSFKDKIIQFVQDSKHRTLRLDGDIRLSFFPDIGASLAKVSLSEFKDNKEFASVESARVSLAVLPLLRKQFVVNEVALNGLHATLVKYKDGTSNMDDLLTQNEKQPGNVNAEPVEFDVQSVSIMNANLSYRDEQVGTQYSIQNLMLKMGRVANGVSTPIDFSAGIQASQPALDVVLQLKAKLTLDLDKQQYRLQGMDVQLTGNALEVTGLKLNATGDAGADLAKNEFSAQKFTVGISGMQAKQPFEAKLYIPALSMSDDQFSGGSIVLNVNRQAAMSNFTAVLKVPSLEGNRQFFRVGALALDMELKQSQQTFAMKSSGQITGDLQTQQFNLNNYTIALNATGDKLPNRSVSSELRGNVQLDVLKQNLQANLAGGLLHSQIKAKVEVDNFANPAIKFDVDLDQLDADMYLPSSPAASSKSNEPEVPIDVSGLRKLNLEGGLRIGALKVMNVKSRDLRVDVQAHSGIIKVDPLSANLYQGHAVGAFSINAQGVPVVTVNQNLSNINVATLGKDAAGFDTLEGRGNVGINLLLQGATLGEMKRSANGSLSLNLADGAIKGINIAKKIRDAKSLLGAKSQSQNANKEEKTDFSELKASFKVINGIAHNDDLSMKSPLLRLSGNGDINIGNDSINYLAQATLAKTLEGQGGQDNVRGVTVPIRVSGPFTDLKYRLDFSAMVSEETKAKVGAAKAAAQQQIEAKKDMAKQKIDEKKAEVKTQLQDEVRNTLKGLFK